MPFQVLETKVKFKIKSRIGRRLKIFSTMSTGRRSKYSVSSSESVLDSLFERVQRLLIPIDSGSCTPLYKNSLSKLNLGTDFLFRVRCFAFAVLTSWRSELLDVDDSTGWNWPVEDSTVLNWLVEDSTVLNWLVEDSTVLNWLVETVASTACNCRLTELDAFS